MSWFSEAVNDHPGDPGTVPLGPEAYAINRYENELSDGMTWQEFFDSAGDPGNVFGEEGDLLEGPQQAQDQYLSTMDQIVNDWLGLANEQEQLYDQYFAPFEKEFVKNAERYARPDYAGAVARAGGAADSAIRASEGATARNAARYGLDPNSETAKALADERKLGNAAMRAGLQTGAVRDEKRRAQTTGWAGMTQALSLGHGLPTQAGAAMAAGAGALNDMYGSQIGQANNLNQGAANAGLTVGYATNRR